MAQIDVSKIENFAELDADALRKLIKDFVYEDNANALNELKVQVQKLSKAKDDATSEAAEYKRQLREKMSEAERLEEERKEELNKLKTENETFRQNALLSEYKAQALSMGYSDELATQRAEAMVKGDFNAMAEVDKAFIAAHDREMEANAIINTPKPPVGASNPDKSGTVTPEQFKAMGYGERAKLFEENPELYNELSS